MNKLRYSDNGTERKFEAEFTDTIGENVAGTFRDFVQSKISSNLLGQGNPPGNGRMDAEEGNTPEGETEETSTKGKPNLLQDIFRYTDKGFSLLDTRLVAKSKADYAQRLTYLALLYNEQRGMERTPRGIITSLLRKAGVYDGNYRRWFAKCKDFTAEKDGIELIVPGRNRAISIQAELKNREQTTGWMPGASAGRSSTRSAVAKRSTDDNKEESERKHARASGKNRTEAQAVVQEEFDAHKKPKTLAQLFKEKGSPESTPLRILLVAYYITRLLGQKTFSDGQVDYAYRLLGVNNRPKFLHQTIVNLKNQKVWFKKAEGNRWELTRNGEIAAEEISTAS